jgi:hypothetical protein
MPYISAITGKYVTEAYAKKHPNLTVHQTNKKTTPPLTNKPKGGGKKP